MWERSSRHNPLSFRYQLYRDHRPVLPQDPTTDWALPRHSNFNLYYYLVNMGGKNKYICSNNIPVNDRSRLQTLVEFRQHAYSKLGWAAIVPAVFFSAILFRRVTLPYKLLYPVTFYLFYKLSHGVLFSQVDILLNDNISYFYHKYSHLAVENLEAVRDPRRQHFRVDTDVYYRQTAHELLHGAHGHGDHDAGAHEDHHDTSTYYGPYPVRKKKKIIFIIIENL